MTKFLIGFARVPTKLVAATIRHSSTRLCVSTSACTAKISTVRSGDSSAKSSRAWFAKAQAASRTEDNDEVHAADGVRRAQSRDVFARHVCARILVELKNGATVMQ